MKRGPNGTAETRRLILLPRELDEAITASAHKRGLAVAEWIRRVLARAAARDTRG